ncbi:MAG TPA: hypothetical protein PK747_10840 [Acidobacteriota bacterium]|nr:hypothetical protein [Acidobacteriota bacterium]HNT18168.1 hypothetical protein [Acidobacteriota bacterium]HQO21100.1 hypothetical protein [Acidobacteriota bacterium]HQQ47886.1 hypothetical protein [Acidobacteriota bacterium]
MIKMPRRRETRERLCPAFDGPDVKYQRFFSADDRLLLHVQDPEGVTIAVDRPVNR